MNFGSLGQRWNTLTRNQQIAVAVVGALLLYGVLVSIGPALLDPARQLSLLAWLLAVLMIVFVALPVHEFAHAAAAVALGDDTPRRQGRYTLNPIAHIDPLGAVLIAVTGFGWAKPVQWRPGNITMDPRWGSIIVSMAGPLSNLAMAVLGAVLMRTSLMEISWVVSHFLDNFMRINVLLFVFNLIPIPPLDGSHVLFALLPGDTFRLQRELSRYGFMILLLVVFLAPGIVGIPTSALMNLLRP